MPSFYIPSQEKKDEMNFMIESLKKDLSDNLIEVSFKHDEVTIIVNKNSLYDVIQLLKDDRKYFFKQLIDITAVDYPAKNSRFEIVYNLLSLYHNLRIRVKINIIESDIIDSISLLYINADWLEREVYDMFGVFFKGHKDLRRILTDFGFEGYPLRKDFPLTGFVEVEFNEEYQKVMYKPVELMQEYRDYSYRNPWMDNIEAETFDYLKKKDINE